MKRLIEQAKLPKPTDETLRSAAYQRFLAQLP
jgi:hypothetical protein